MRARGRQVCDRSRRSERSAVFSVAPVVRVLNIIRTQNMEIASSTGSVKNGLLEEILLKMKLEASRCTKGHCGSFIPEQSNRHLVGEKQQPQLTFVPSCSHVGVASAAEDRQRQHR